MRGIIVSQTSQRLVAAPGQLRPRHEAMKETKIQIVKNLVEIIILALGTLNAFASTQLADKLRFPRHGMAAGIFAVTRGMGSVDLFAIKLGNEDMQDGIQHRLR